jgi:pimeloyl-ACP methyl ester carboxylesterase
VGALLFGVRLVVVLAVGLVLTGCSNLLLFQDPNEVIVRVGDEPERYSARDVAKTYAGYAQLAALAYDDVTDGSQYDRWKFIRVPKFECPPDRICAGELGVQLWVHMRGRTCHEAVISFRGTVFSSFDDWIANFHWFNRLTPIYDYYDQAGGHIDEIVSMAERIGCRGRIVAVGHSLGGGLAQHVAYGHPRIRIVYAFDPSFVIGIGDFAAAGEQTYRKNRLFDYVYEHGEILALLRYIGRQFHPYEACHPRIRTVRFNTLTGSFISQHRIQSLADKMKSLAASPPPPPAPAAAPSGLRAPFIPDAPCPRPA